MPSLVLLLAGCTRPPDLEALQDPESCAGCHPTHVEEWEGSMHAYASEDPLFRFLNELGQQQTDGELGDFCVRCHAPLAVELGLTEDGLNLDDLDDRVQGVGCYTCHSVTGVQGAHNNPLTFATDGVMRGGLEDPVRTSAHDSRHSPLLDRTQGESAAVCGSCHDIVTPKGSHIERTYAEWSESLYGNPAYDTQNLTCGQCHMGGEDAPAAVVPGKDLPERRRHAHTFPGVDLALTPFPHRDLQRELVKAELATVINPQLCVSNNAGQSTLTVDLEQLPAGHSFPSGASADRRVWVELVAYANEVEVFETGRIPEGVAVRSIDDANRWELGDRHLDRLGRETPFFWEVEEVDPSALLAPTARDQADPEWRETHQIRTWQVPSEVDRVELRMWMRPFGLDIVDTLIPDGLDPTLRAEIPTFALTSASLDWTEELERPCVR